MCGICGKLSPAGVRLEELQAMALAITHRGPDDEGFYLERHIGLGCRRLSIVDVAGGHQPIANEDGTVWIAYNGELYNYRELRQLLEQRGHIFRTNTDTEVIVHLYEELGEDCVSRLNGMFAFAIWDARKDQLFLARDHIGQKPLFYAQEGQDFYFASEIKAILAASKQAREIDYDSLHDYLSLRFIPPPRTMLRTIHKLPPAHTLVVRGNTLAVKRYWALSFRDKVRLPEGQYAERLHDTLLKTLDAHLMGDVRVGAFLSGGMDSSIIVAMLAKKLGSPLPTFSVGVQEADFNELPYARLVADHCHTQHEERCVEPNLIQSLPEIIWHLDEPSDPIAACQFAAANLASHHVKVVLGGDGGDELFAGFDRYLGIQHLDLYASIPPIIRQELVGPLLARIPDSFAYKGVVQRLRWAHRLAMQSHFSRQYAEATCFFRFSHEDKRDLFGEDLWNQVGHRDSADIIAEQVELAQADDDLDRMLYADFMTRLPEHSLMLADRMTMAHGVELRSPFLDRELVEMMASFPSDLKIRNQELKHILRVIAQDYLPQMIVRRKKHGFMFPIAYWFRTELYPFIRAVLPNSFFVRNGLFRKESVIKLIEEHRNSKVDHHVRLWMLLNLELWHQIYIERIPYRVVAQNLRTHAPQHMGLHR